MFDSPSRTARIDSLGNGRVVIFGVMMSYGGSQNH
jgi:hypothetical protein